MKTKRVVIAWVRPETAEAIEDIARLARRNHLGCYDEPEEVAGCMLEKMALDVLRCLRSETYYAKVLKVAEKARQRREAN